MGEPVSAVVILIQAISGKGEFILRYPEESGFPWKPESRVAVAQAQGVGPGVSGGRFPSHVQPSSAVLARSPRPRSQVQASAPAAASEGACPQQIGSYVGTEERWGRRGGGLWAVPLGRGTHCVHLPHDKGQSSHPPVTFATGRYARV